MDAPIDSKIGIPKKVRSAVSTETSMTRIETPLKRERLCVSFTFVLCSHTFSVHHEVAHDNPFIDKFLYDFSGYLFNFLGRIAFVVIDFV